MNRWLTVGATFLAFSLVSARPTLRRAGSPRVAAAEPAPRIVAVQFPPGSVRMPLASVRELHEAVLGSEASSMIWVVGYAREHEDLRSNLDLAERRAGAVARHLMDMGTVSERIHIAARESDAGDDGNRVDVRLLEPAFGR
jgi:hypothetical protein